MSTSQTVTWPVEGGGGGSGTVTSVGLSAPAMFLVTGSPVTTAGTLIFDFNAQSGNKVIASPADGSSGVPDFRALVAADIPSLSGVYLPLAGGTMSGDIDMGSHDLIDISKIYDTAGSPVLSVDVANRTLTSSIGPHVTVNWYDTTLHDAFTGAGSADWSNRLMYDSSGTGASLDWEDRLLKASDSTTALDWSSPGNVVVTGSLTASNLYNSSALLAINLDASTLVSRTGSFPVRIDWESGLMYDAAPQIALTWGGRTLNDSAGAVAAAWGGRTLNDSAAATVLDWNTAITLATAAQAAANSYATTVGTGDVVDTYVSGTLTLQTGANSGTEAYSGDLNIKTGNTSGGTVTNSASGNVTISTGQSTSEYTGVISLITGSTSDATKRGEIFIDAKNTAVSRPLKTNASGALTSALIDLASGNDVTGVAPIQTAIFNETQSSGTNGNNGAVFSSGSWATRFINTTQQGQSWASIASNQITLTAGTYLIEASAPAYSIQTHQTRFYNITDSSVAITGTSDFAASTGGVGYSRSIVSGVITIASTKTFELQHQCGGTNVATNGFGIGCGFGAEVFSVVGITKQG